MGNVEVKEAFKSFKKAKNTAAQSGINSEVLFEDSVIEGLLKQLMSNMNVGSINMEKAFSDSNIYKDQKGLDNLTTEERNKLSLTNVNEFKNYYLSGFRNPLQNMDLIQRQSKYRS